MAGPGGRGGGGDASGWLTEDFAELERQGRPGRACGFDRDDHPPGHADPIDQFRGDQSRLAWASRDRDEPGNKIPLPRIWMHTCLVSLLHFVSVEKS